MRFIFAVLLSLFLVGCSSKTPYTNRSQLMLISENEEMQMGEKGYKEFLQKAKISTNEEQTKRIERIMARIAKAANKPEYKWEIHLVEDKQVNAWCMPGGKMVVYTGILPLAKNDDQLATVISHEVAHALARHGAERLSQQQMLGIAQQLGSIAVATKAPNYTGAFNTAYGYAATLGVMLPYSREHEYEADEIGLYLMHKAGYNIDESIKFWENMRQLKKGEAPPEFLSTHPNDEHRIEKLKQIIRKIKSQEKK
jgi:predicted Zn-dependent protease